MPLQPLNEIQSHNRDHRHPYLAQKNKNCHGTPQYPRPPTSFYDFYPPKSPSHQPSRYSPKVWHQRSNSWDDQPIPPPPTYRERGTENLDGESYWYGPNNYGARLPYRESELSHNRNATPSPVPVFYSENTHRSSYEHHYYETENEASHMQPRPSYKAPSPSNEHTRLTSPYWFPGHGHRYPSHHNGDGALDKDGRTLYKVPSTPRPDPEYFFSEGKGDENLYGYRPYQENETPNKMPHRQQSPSHFLKTDHSATPKCAATKPDETDCEKHLHNDEPNTPYRVIPEAKPSSDPVQVTPEPKLKAKPGDLQQLDIVCGRGAPINYHYGNQAFRELVAGYQTSYLCAKRSDKPLIAFKILDLVKANGSRFVRREKTSGRFAWVEIGDKCAYEKICQALREGTPDLRRQVISCIKKK